MGIVKQLQLLSHMKNKDGLYHVCNAVLTKNDFNKLIKYWNFQHPNYCIDLIK